MTGAISRGLQSLAIRYRMPRRKQLQTAVRLPLGDLIGDHRVGVLLYNAVRKAWRSNQIRKGSPSYPG